MMEVISPLPDSTVTKTPQIEITDIVYKAKVKRVQSDEYVEIVNQTAQIADISGWQLVSGVGRSKTFTFPAGTTLTPSQAVRVYTNEIHPETGGFSFGSGLSLWKDTGDEAQLLDAQGNWVSGLAYDKDGNFTKPQAKT
ncbi:MAG: lamin tail domain-containing protein [Kamptonema sp. SIO4C4]|nr:lamin tail domain-containing protein [Kamptonema sp. SIO4C4]